MAEWTFPTAFSSWSYGDDGLESAAIDRVLRSGRMTMGPEVEAFEEEFASYHDRRHGIMVNSGSSANLISVAAIYNRDDMDDVKAHGGDPSASLPAIAWSTTYAPFAQFGYLVLNIRDVDETWNSPALVKESYWDDVHVSCSVLGSSAYLDEDRAWATEHGKLMIEDNCESLGARTPEGRLCGTFGDLSTFSFFYSHQISAIEGGMILTDDDELAQLCRLLRNHGNAGWGAEKLEDVYRFEVFGYNLRPLEMHAAIAREQLRKLTGMVDARWKNWLHFTRLADGLPIKLQEMRGSPSPFGLAFECESKEARARLALALRAAGIDCRLPTGGSFLKHKYSAPWQDQKTPRADLVHDTGMFLGCAPFPIPELIERAAKVIKETL
jgi:CDP-6-deoxy-D-xylo-4-hexulose-3-dehydrase